MLKITGIKIQDDFRILCIFNNGVSKTIDVLPLLQDHKHLPGIEKLKDENAFAKARVGLFGEIIWDNIIEMKNGDEKEIWDYDISPEFAFYNGVTG
jgi:Protein of unknown function (DUF2442)